MSITENFLEMNLNEYFEDDKLNYTFKVIAKCRSCKKFHVDFFLNVYSDKPISNILNNLNNIAFSTRNTAKYEGQKFLCKKLEHYLRLKNYLPN